MSDAVNEALTETIVAKLRTAREARAQATLESVVPAAPLSPYLLAAAVLHVFDPVVLHPCDGGIKKDSYDQLFARSAVAVGWPRMRILRVDVRLAALRQLGTREAMLKALAANPDRQTTPVQRLLEEAINGDLGSLSQRSFSELEQLNQLYEWKINEIISMPAVEIFREAHRRRASIARFDHLVDDNFIGRQAELQKLRDHVGAVSPSVWARVRGFFSSNARPPLFLSGPGGAGKTALLGRFLVEYVETPSNGWFPFAYVAFDSDVVEVSEPFTLLIEIAQQMIAQVTQAASPAAGRSLEDTFRLYRASVARYRDDRGTLVNRASSFSNQRERISMLGKSERQLLEELATFLHRLTDEAAAQQNAKSIPVLIVFDSFEEVIYRAREELIGFWRTLSALSQFFPPLRVVIAGRAGPGQADIHSENLTEYVLPDLNVTDSTELLKRLGVVSAGRAETIARQVGGNPLTLRLAARVASEEQGTGGIDGLKTRRFGLLSISPALIRGQLYRRVLDHIHDDDVRALAHPGMVLRRVTPEIIENVLAPICLTSMSEVRALDLFDRLRDEHALVRLEGDGSLRYREEVRRPVLELLMQDRPDEVRHLHRAAINYYSAFTDENDPLNRAEELYHRLMLEQAPWDLELRWFPGVSKYLFNTIEEIPLAQRVWLAQRMSITLPDEVYMNADLEAWENLTAQKVLRLLRYNDFELAANLLKSRGDRSAASPLFALEARVLMALNQQNEAVALLERALSEYPPMGDRNRSAQLLWLYAQALINIGRIDEATGSMEMLVDVANSLPSRLPLVQALTELVALVDAHDPSRADAARDQLASSLLALTLSDADSERSLVRLALVRLGPAFPRTAERLLDCVYMEWLNMVRIEQIDIGETIGPARSFFARSDIKDFNRLGGRNELADPSTDLVLLEELSGLISQLGSKSDSDALLLDVAALKGIYCLLGAEGATLASANLAGIEVPGQDGESGGTKEVQA